VRRPESAESIVSASTRTFSGSRIRGEGGPSVVLGNRLTAFPAGKRLFGGEEGEAARIGFGVIGACDLQVGFEEGEEPAGFGNVVAGRQEASVLSGGDEEGDRVGGAAEIVGFDGDRAEGFDQDVGVGPLRLLGWLDEAGVDHSQEGDVVSGGGELAGHFEGDPASKRPAGEEPGTGVYVPRGVQVGGGEALETPRRVDRRGVLEAPDRPAGGEGSGEVDRAGHLASRGMDQEERRQ
jgi:hypothetical protein